MESFFYTPEQHKTNCGKLLASTLQFMGKGTAADIIEEISYNIGRSEEIVERDVKNALRKGIINGFLIKQGNLYMVPKHAYEVDSTANKRSRLATPRSKIDRKRLTIASKSQNKRRKLNNESRTRSRSALTPSRSLRASRSKSQSK